MREQRTAAGSVQMRSGTAGAGAGTLIGYAAIFGSPTIIAGQFREQIKRGAFTQAIGRDDVRCLVNHSASAVLGRTKAGTLRLSEDSKGLRYEVDLPDTSFARDLMVSVTRGDISQSSFAFEVLEDEWDFSAGRSEKPLRSILSARLMDCSPVTYPAYEDTTVTARSAEGDTRMSETAIDRNAQGGTSLTRMVLDVERHRDAIRDGNVKCATCGEARATMLRRSAGSTDYKRICVDCSFTGDRTKRSAGSSVSAPRPISPISTYTNPDIERMREKLRRAERGETINPPARPRPAVRVEAPADGYRTPKHVPTQYGSEPATWELD